MIRHARAVGERSVLGRRGTARSPGRNRNENVGTSSDKTGEKPVRRKPKVSWARLILPGLVGPKPRSIDVGEGNQVNIPNHVVPCYRWGDAGGYTRKDRPSLFWGVVRWRRQIPVTDEDEALRDPDVNRGME